MLSGFELYSRWVPLKAQDSVVRESNIHLDGNLRITVLHYKYFKVLINILPVHVDFLLNHLPLPHQFQNTVEPLGTDTSLLRTVSNVPTKFSYIFFKKNLYNTYSLYIPTTDTKSRIFSRIL